MFPQLAGKATSNAPVYNTKGLGPDNKMINGIATQNLGGNSLTQQLRSVQNWLGTTGSDTYGKGMGVADTGIQGFGTAGDTTGTALDTTKGALATLTPAESYWSKLLSGDQKTMNEAIAPTATQVGANYANASSNVAMNQPRGGYAGVLSAGLPQAQARELNNYLYQLQPTAATNLNTIAGTKNQIAGTQGNIAGVQGQLANWLASLGIDISKLGLQGVTAANDSLLGGRGQDVAEHGQAMQMATALASELMGGADKAITQATSKAKTSIPLSAYNTDFGG